MSGTGLRPAVPPVSLGVPSQRSTHSYSLPPGMIPT